MFGIPFDGPEKFYLLWEPTDTFIDPLRFHVILDNIFMYFAIIYSVHFDWINPLTPNDHFSGRTAPLTSKLCILYIYWTNIATEYFKHGIYSSFLPLQNAVCFIILTYLVLVLFTCYIQGVQKKLKKIIPAPKV